MKPKTTDLTTTDPNTGLAVRESFIPAGDRTGTEQIDPSELKLPKLSFAQGLSTQLIRGDSSYIPNLQMFDMFNDLTGTVYGQGPLLFVPVKRDIKRIEFRPRTEGGGILDMNVPLRDPRTEWTSGPDGKRLPPRATRFTEFVILLVTPEGLSSPMVLSFKETNKWVRKAADKLTGLVFEAKRPIYGALYTVASGTERNDNGTFAVPVIQQAGFLDDPSVSDEVWNARKAIYTQAAAWAARLADATIVTDREAPDTHDYDEGM